MKYDQFLDQKRIISAPSGIAKPPRLSPKLFPFQRDITTWVLKRGRAAIWADCGLGKSWMALEWARVVSKHGPVLILTPLAVAQQFVGEGEKLGVKVKLCRDGADVCKRINVTNYERLHRFDLSMFAGVVADESSILKDYTSATRNAIIDGFSQTPYRLACTATPAPNDHMELGNHAEFLGAMSRTEMLSMFFVHDGGDTSKWRLKGHAQDEFWRWVCTWAVSLKYPSDLGYEDDGFRLPPLEHHEHIVEAMAEFAAERGLLFATHAQTLEDQRAARKASLAKRVGVTADIVNASPETWVCWCDLNAESEALTKAIDGAVEIRGSDTPEHKEERIHAFTRGEIRVLVTKPSIAGWGVNWQHCAHVAFVGLSHSFEQYYQAVRRTWRFGQTRPVECHIITSDAEHAVVSNLKRKQADAEHMARSMISEMADLSVVELGGTKRSETGYNPTERMKIPGWLKGAA